MKQVKIPKDCCVCDVCNRQLTDGNFIAIEYCNWFEGWLYCSDCEAKYEPTKIINCEACEGSGFEKREDGTIKTCYFCSGTGLEKGLKLIRSINKGDDLSNTDLAEPIIIESGDEF